MAKGINIQITGDAASIVSALEQVDAHLKETAEHAKEHASHIGEAMEMIKRRLEMVGIDFALYEAIDKVKELTEQALEFGEAIQRASEKTGLTTETLSVLHYAAQTTGGDFDNMTSAVSKMDKTIGAAAAGGKLQMALMKELGLNAKDLANRTDGAEIAWNKFTQVMGATENPVARVRLATEMLGKAGSEQIPTIIELATHWDELKEKTQAAGMYLDGPAAKALEETNRKFAEMKQNVLGATLAFTEGLTPGLVKLIGVIAGGASPLETMKNWGEDISHGLARTTTAVDLLIASMYELRAIGDMRASDTAEDHASSDAWMKRAHAAYDTMKKPIDPHFLELLGPDTPPDNKGYKITDKAEKEGKPKGDNGMAAAAAALAEAQATASAQVLKSADDLKLAQLDASHKLLLTSDQDYYAEKLRLQEDELDVEAEAIRTRMGDLYALSEKQRGDKTLKRDKSGQSAEELRTARELVVLDQQLNTLEEKKAAIKVNSGLADQERADAVHLANLKAAAQVEEQTNSGIQARLELMRLEQQLAMQKVSAAGGDVAGLRVLQQQQQELLRIGDIERQIRETEAEGALAVAAQKDREQKDPTQRKAATKEINALNQQTAQTLKELVAQYDALAATLGGEFVEKARALHAELDKLNTPDKKQDGQFAKTLGEGVVSMASQMAVATASGKDSFHRMAQSIEQDVIRLAIKLAAQKWLTPLLGAAGGVGGGGDGDFSSSMVAALSNFNPHADGGDMSSPGLVGERGPEIFVPQTRGTILPNEALQNLGKTSGGGMNVTMNLTNNSSQPVTARQTGSSFDADSKSWMVHTILEDMSQGGPISQAMRG